MEVKAIKIISLEIISSIMWSLLDNPYRDEKKIKVPLPSRLSYNASVYEDLISC